MIDWIGYGWMAGDVSGTQTYYTDLVIEVPRGDIVAACAVTGFSVGVQQHEPGSVAVYVREYGRFRSSTMINVVDVPPDPTNNVLPISDCAFVRFRMTVFQGRAFSLGLVFRHAPRVPEPRAPSRKFSARDFVARTGGRDVGHLRMMLLSRGSRLDVDAVLERTTRQAARFLDLRRRELEIVPAKKQRTRPGEAGPRPGIF